MRRVCLSIVAAVLGLGVHFPADALDWPMSACNPQRTYRTEEEVGGPFTLRWRRYFNDAWIPNRIEPIVAHGMVYVGTSKGVYALDAKTGKDRWVFPTELPLGHAPAVSLGQVYVPCLDKHVYAVDALTGQLRWKFRGGAGFFNNPLPVGDVVYIGCLDGQLYALNAKDGALKWSFKTDGPIYFSPAYSRGRVYFGSNDMHGYAVDAETGKLVWRTDKLPGKSMDSFWPVVAERASAVIFVVGHAYRAQNLGNLDHEVKQQTWPWLGAGQHKGGIYTDEQLRNLERITIDYFNRYPHRKNFLIIDADTGKEKQVAPVLWVGNAGNRMPPVIGGDGLCYMTIHHDHSIGALLGGCHLVSFDIEKNQFVKCFNYHGGQTFCNLVGDEPHGLSMAGNILYGHHHYDTAGTIDVRTNQGWRISGYTDVLQSEGQYPDVNGQSYVSKFFYRNPHYNVSSITIADGQIYISTKQANAIYVFQGGGGR